jgi:predicted secreted protein
MLAREGASLRIVGLAGSPSCSVITTSSGHIGGLLRAAEHAHVGGRGVFKEELLAELVRRSVAFRAEEDGRTEGTGGEC